MAGESGGGGVAAPGGEHPPARLAAPLAALARTQAGKPVPQHSIPPLHSPASLAPLRHLCPCPALPLAPGESFVSLSAVLIICQCSRKFSLSKRLLVAFQMQNLVHSGQSELASCIQVIAGTPGILTSTCQRQKHTQQCPSVSSWCRCLRPRIGRR